MTYDFERGFAHRNEVEDHFGRTVETCGTCGAELIFDEETECFLVIDLAVADYGKWDAHEEGTCAAPVEPGTCRVCGNPAPVSADDSSHDECVETMVAEGRPSAEIGDAVRNAERAALVERTAERNAAAHEARILDKHGVMDEEPLVRLGTFEGLRIEREV